MEKAMQIAINFKKPPRLGRTSTLLRCHFEDKKDIEKAAKIVGITTAAFIRAVIIQASRTIIADGSEFQDAKVKDKG